MTERYPRQLNTIHAPVHVKGGTERMLLVRIQMIGGEITNIGEMRKLCCDSVSSSG